MSGHSKWASIKHKKAIVDSKRGKEFTKVANMVTIAAKQGGKDPKMNFALRLAMDKARVVNMPAANIERAIKRGTGELGGAAPVELLYEGYGPAGVAILVEAMTDNRNRTASEVRSTFSKYGGSMAEAGAVSYIFQQKGLINIVTANQHEKQEELELLIIDSGAEDFEYIDNELVVYTLKSDLQNVKEYLETSGIKIENAEITYIPNTETKINEANIASKVMKLIDVLEENEDVTAVHANFDIPEEILEKMN